MKNVQRTPSIFDRQEIRPGRIVLVLLGERERMDLRIAAEAPVGGCHGQQVHGFVEVRMNRRNRADEGHDVGRRLLLEEPCAGSVHRLGDLGGVHGKTGREHLGQHDQLRSGRGGVGDHRLDDVERRLRIFPFDGVLEGGDPHGGPRGWRRRSVGGGDQLEAEISWRQRSVGGRDQLEAEISWRQRSDDHRPRRARRRLGHRCEASCNAWGGNVYGPRQRTQGVTSIRDPIGQPASGAARQRAACNDRGL